MRHGILDGSRDYKYFRPVFTMENNSNSSSKTLSVIVGIVVVVVIIWLIVKATNKSAPVTTPTDTTTAQSATPAQDATTASASDTSDTSITGDTANVDTQMSGLGSDNTSADQSLSSTSK